MEFKLKSIENVLEVRKIANVHFFEFENDYQTSEDSHSFSELLFSYAGTLNVNAENYQGKLRKGELLIHKENEKHSLRTHKNRKTTIIIIGFSTSSSEKLDIFSKAPIKLDEQETKMLARIVKEGRNVFAPPYDTPLYDMKKKKNQIYGSEQMLRVLLEAFLLEIIRKHVYFGTREESSDGGFLPSEIIAYIDSHYKDKITLDEISFLFNTNRSAFCKSFKSITGMTFLNYIAEKKLKKVKDLLLDGKMSLVEISDAVGFDNSAYLCRFFKKHTGLTPKEFKKTRPKLDTGNY